MRLCRTLRTLKTEHRNEKKPDKLIMAERCDDYGKGTGGLVFPVSSFWSLVSSIEHAHNQLHTRLNTMPTLRPREKTRSPLASISPSVQLILSGSVGQANKSKGRMPWRQEPKKDVESDEKPRGGANSQRSADVRMGKPGCEDHSHP